jgi:hypothetical protein
MEFRHVSLLRYPANISKSLSQFAQERLRANISRFQRQASVPFRCAGPFGTACYWVTPQGAGALIRKAALEFCLIPRGERRLLAKPHRFARVPARGFADPDPLARPVRIARFVEREGTA